MPKFLLIILIFTGCQGCSFIQDKFGNGQNQDPNQQQEEQQQQRPSQPIPVNPQHS